MEKTTAIANSNIAIIKYWGRRDEELIIPNNNSISFTMDDQLQTKTTVEFDKNLKKDEFILDGKTASEKEFNRLTKFLDIVRDLAKKKIYAKIKSTNSFPKAAGLASSASGFAALAAAASKAIGHELHYNSLSALARRGSGSAARSIPGGAVEWQIGKKKDGSDCFAFQISPPEKWSHLRNVIAISNSHEKKVNSTDGMKRINVSSDYSLYYARIRELHYRLKTVKEAIKNVDFSSMAEAIMKESNNMHAVMLDSYPPVFYLNEMSFRIMDAVIEFNKNKGENVAAYTFDAGPNAHIYTTVKYESEIRGLLEDLNKNNEIEKIMTCKVGQGSRYIDEHLF